MSKELEALGSLMADYYEMCQDLGNNDDQYQRCNLTSERAIVEKGLKELDKIKARLTVVQMKISAHREECIQNMEHTDEDTFMHEASKITIDCLDWFRQLIQEVLS